MTETENVLALAAYTFGYSIPWGMLVCSIIAVCILAWEAVSE